MSVAASLFMIVGFLIAIPHGVTDLLGQPKNPLVYIFQSHFGAIAAGILQVVVFLAIFSCVLANTVVATRPTFALSHRHPRRSADATRSGAASARRRRSETSWPPMTW